MTREDMKGIVAEAIAEQMDAFFIERETHYKDHQFVTDLRESAEKVQGVACKTVTSTLIVGGIGFIIWAFRHWLGDMFGAPK